MNLTDIYMTPKPIVWHSRARCFDPYFPFVLPFSGGELRIDDVVYKGVHLVEGSHYKVTRGEIAIAIQLLITIEDNLDTCTIKYSRSKDQKGGEGIAFI